MFSDRLRGLRIQSKKTQKDLADFLGITRQGYGSYENGITEPDNKTLNDLADYFDVDTDYLLGRSDVKKKNGINKETEPVYRMIARAKELPPEQFEQAKKFIDFLYEQGNKKDEE
ncbi:helix-turn-helix domain-containing protein [Paenibacillus sp. TAB 01]|uniref:helix-turn-helix domain-containing protein n=1 Tax=Paenibacillus sp. TAB 01 TaxID=3368988 RepID=UPI003751A4A5